MKQAIKQRKMILSLFLIPVIVILLTSCSTAHKAATAPRYGITCNNDTIFFYR